MSPKHILHTALIVIAVVYVIQHVGTLKALVFTS